MCNLDPAVQRRTLAVLAVMQVVGTIGVGVAPSIGVLLAGEVTDSEAWAGLARTASTLGAALFGLPLGTLAARRGRRIALASGWWIAAAGAAVLVLAAQLSLVVPLIVGLLLIGSGSAVALQSRFAATDLAPARRRGRDLALIVWVGTLGSVLGPNLGAPGELVAAGTGLTVYASAFLLAAVALAGAGLIVMIWLRPDPLLLATSQAPPDAAAPRRRGRIALILGEIRTNPRARYALIAILTAQIVMVAMMTMTPVHLAHHGDSVTVIGLTISLHIVGMFALAPLVGIISDLRGPRLTVAIGIAILACSLVIGAVRPAETGWIVVSLFLLGLGWSFVNVAGSALFAAAVPDRIRAASQGGVDAMSNLSGAAAAFLAGPVLSVVGYPILSGLAMAILVPLAVLTLRRR